MEEWLTTEEAAQHLRIERRTMSEWARQGKVPAYRLSGVQRTTWRFRKSDLDDMLTRSLASSAEKKGRQ
jgi:excisionase family DNA binding protein